MSKNLSAGGNGTAGNPASTVTPLSTPAPLRAAGGQDMTTHTPGPWKVAPELTGKGDVSHYIFEDEADPAELLASIHYVNESEANAALIASAPDLLAALRRLESAVTTSQSGAYLDVVCAEARAAIARAEGRT